MIIATFLWYWLFQDRFQALIGSWKEELVDKRGDMTTQFERLRYMLRRMDAATPGIVPPGWESVSGHRKLINPGNNAQITGESTTENFARQGRYQVILADEFGRLESSIQEEIWTGTADASPCRIFNSTPQGMDNAFAQICVPRRDLGNIIDPITGEPHGDDPTKVMLLHWTLHPDKGKNSYYLDDKGQKVSLTAEQAYRRQMNGQKVSSPWHEAEVIRRRKDENVSRRMLAQELDLDFTASGSLVFDPDDLRRGLANSREPPGRAEVLVNLWPKRKIRKRHDGPIYLYASADRTKPYALFADAAQALDDESDFNAFAVIDCIDYKIVCTGMTRWSIPDFTRVLCIVGYMYNNALLAVESNDVGQAILSIMTGRIGFTTKDEYQKRVNSGVMMYNRLYVDWVRAAEQMKRTSRIGWRTSRASKREMITGLDKLIADGHIEIPDPRFWRQAASFMNLPGGKIGSKLSNDDLVIAVAGAAAIAPEGRQHKPVPPDNKGESASEIFYKMLGGRHDLWEKVASMMRVR